MKIFLQFYKEEAYLYGDDIMVNFLNGLSHVWNQIKNEGELVWRDVEDETPPPITEGSIYASVWYTKSLILLYRWAKEFPNLEIFICGPIVAYSNKLNIGNELSNFHSTQENAEDIFFNGATSEWNLEVPKTDRAIGYSVSLTNGVGCYWGKCRFCSITGALKYRNMDRVPVIENDNHKFIWIHTYSIPPNLIKKLYPTFENRKDVSYATYSRGDKYTTNALKETIPKLLIDPKYLGFNVGIEFPSNKMLRYMNKGVIVKEYLDFIKLASEYNIRLHFNFIIGWKPTNIEDVKNVEYFLNQLSRISKANTITAHIYSLYIRENKDIMLDYTMNELEPIESDFKDFIGIPKLNDKEKILNNKIRSLYHSYPFMKIQEWNRW